MTLKTWFPVLFLAAVLPAQPLPPPQPAPAQAVAPAPGPGLKAQYQWGYAGADGQGKGQLNVLIALATGRAVVELQGLGERLMLLEGDATTGYRVQIPRQKIDASAPSFAAVPLPFFPQLGSVAALYRLLSEGTGAGVTVTSKDALGPVKLKYQGTDDRGREVMVWLKRTRWDLPKS